MNFNSNQRSKVIQGLRSFKDPLPTKVKKLLKQKGEVYSELIENWRMFVGDELFSLSYPKKRNSKINLGEIENKKIENSLKEFAKVFREKND